MRWKSPRGILVIALLAAAVAGAGALTARWRSQAKTPERETRPLTLHVDPKYLDFGRAWETDRFEWAIPIENRDTKLAELTDLSGSCCCNSGSVEPTALSIPPGETRTVRIRLDLRPKPGEKPDPAGRPFATAISATFKNGTDAARRVSWNIRGRVKRTVRTAAAVEFGPLSELAAPFPPLVIPIEPLAEIESVTATVSVLEFRVAVRRKRGEEPGWELVVTPDPELKRGAYKGTVTLTPVGAGGTPLASLQLPVSADVIPDVEAVPAAIFAGGREVGAEVTETLSLRSLSDRRFAVERAEAEGSGVSLTADAGGRSFTVRVRVTAAGPGNGRVRLVVRPEGAAPIELVVPVHVHGFSAQ